MSIPDPVAFPLFPIIRTPDGPRCGCGNPECSRVGKHPAVAWKDLKLGDSVPKPADHAGVGLKTGAAPKGSGFFVLDDDGGEMPGPLPETFTVQTGRGTQYYFQYPGFPVRNSVGELAKGIDIRGDGGFVVAAGSPHKSGKTYEITCHVPPAAAPNWLVEWLRSRAAPAEIRDYPGDIASGPEYQYRHALYTKYLKETSPCVAHRGGDQRLFEVVQYGAYDLQLPTSDVLELIAEHFDPRCVPPWEDELPERVKHKAHSAKTGSTRQRNEPWPHDVVYLLEHNSKQPQQPNDATPHMRILSWDRALRVGGQDIARLKTGFPSIDAATRGGILLRKVGVIGGAPGAGKTALLARISHRWLNENVRVAILAADEEADALLIRLGQLQGLSREALEGGDPNARQALSDWCKAVGLILADGDENDGTIEVVSRDLRKLAGDAPSVLIVDSMQTSRTEVTPPKGADLRTRINETVRALKKAAKADGHLVLASSELSKAAYRNKSQAENVNALSAFKESGDIEYGVSLAVVLTSRSGTNDLVEASVVKNRLGPGKPDFLLRLNHEKADVIEATKAEIETLDPLYFKKAEIREIVEKAHGAPLTMNFIAEQAGGARGTTLKALREMIEAKELFQGKSGVRFPLPGEPGFGG